MYNTEKTQKAILKVRENKFPGLDKAILLDLGDKKFLHVNAIADFAYDKDSAVCVGFLVGMLTALELTGNLESWESSLLAERDALQAR